MSAEQLDKAIRAHALWCAEYGHPFDGLDFAAGWDAHAATMPEREAVEEAIERVLRANGLSDEPAEFDSDIHSWRCGHPEIYGRCSCFYDLAAELLALLNKEGEE